MTTGFNFDRNVMKFRILQWQDLVMQNGIFFINLHCNEEQYLTLTSRQLSL